MSVHLLQATEEEGKLIVLYNDHLVTVLLLMILYRDSFHGSLRHLVRPFTEPPRVQ